MNLAGYKQTLEDLGLSVVVVGNGTPEQAQQFVAEMGYSGKIFVDQNRHFYKGLFCNRGLSYTFNWNTFAEATAAISKG